MGVWAGSLSNRLSSIGPKRAIMRKMRSKMRKMRSKMRKCEVKCEKCEAKCEKCEAKCEKCEVKCEKCEDAYPQETPSQVSCSSIIRQSCSYTLQPQQRSLRIS
jgi:chromosome segregation ATPase